LAEKNKPSKWINAHVKMCEMLKLGKNKIDYENSWTRTKTVCVLGDGKYIGFMAHADTVTTMQCRFRPHYQIWDVANSEPTHNIFKDIYYAVPIGEKWVAATSNPYNGGSLPIYNFLTGNLVVDISEGAPFNYQILGFDKYVVTAGGSISCFDLETGASIFSIDNDDGLYISFIDFHTDGQLKAIVDDQVIFYDMQTLNIEINTTLVMKDMISSQKIPLTTLMRSTATDTL
jgi:hypothetical protein